MEVLRASDHKRTVWKNGKGQTAEIAVFPLEATIDAFDYRVSMASIIEDGEFSTFEDVDRVLVLLEGNGVTLLVDGLNPVEVRRGSAPHRFAGEARTSVAILDGPVIDLNVMVRRDRATCRVTWQHAGSVEAFRHGLTLVFAADPCNENGVKRLAFADCVSLRPGERLALDRDTGAFVVVIGIVLVGALAD